MENAPVITLNGFSPYPGADPELWERFTKWGNEVYVPLMLKNPGRTGSDTYQITRPNPLYPFRLRIHHLTDLASQRRASVSAEQIAIQTDNNTWRTRNVMEVVWGGIYQLAFNFRGGLLVSSPKSDSRIENAPVLHLEAFRFSPEEQEKYNKWFTEYGQNIFIPLYFKQAGVKGYDYYQYAATQQPGNPREREYPACISVLYFENHEAFSQYENSPELSTAQRTLRALFPLGLNYRWYVQYDLQLSSRK